MFGTRSFQHALDEARIKQAIADGERRTSGEIRVSVAPLFWGSVDRAAERAFHRLGMTNTNDRNGILFFVVPSRRAFVVRGDSGIHARVGQAFWESIVVAMAPLFRAGQFTEALCTGIRAAAEALAEHFPYDRDRDANELPDSVDFGEPN